MHREQRELLERSLFAGFRLKGGREGEEISRTRGLLGTTTVSLNQAVGSSIFKRI